MSAPVGWRWRTHVCALLREGPNVSAAQRLLPRVTHQRRKDSEMGVTQHSDLYISFL